MKWFLLMAMCSTAAAQVLPDAPKPQVDRLEWSLLAADGGVRVLDVYSTRRMLSQGNHEVLLPREIADHTWALSLYSAGMVGLQYGVARFLVKHRHRRLAHAVTMVDIGEEVGLDVDNLRLKDLRK